jgi:hypothetical protein
MIIKMPRPNIANLWRRRRRQANPHWLTGLVVATGSSLRRSAVVAVISLMLLKTRRVSKTLLV